MTSTADRRLLTGRRGWAIVVVLALALAMLVGQVQASAASATGLPAAAPPVSSTAPPTPTPTAMQEAAADAGPDAPAVPPASDAPAVPPASDAPAVPPASDAPTDATASGPTTGLAAAPVAAAPPAPAQASEVTPTPGDRCSGDGWQQRRGEAALATLPSGAERTGFAVSFAPGRSGYLGLTHLEQRQIEVFVRGCDVQSDDLLRHVVAHELGHAYDTTRMTAETRAAYQTARGIPAGTEWYGCSGCTDFATPAGDFAEVYAQWARGATDNRSELAGVPGATELAELAVRFFGA